MSSARDYPRSEAASLASAETESDPLQVGLPDGWFVAYDDQGDPYYFHEETRETSWDRPPGSSAPLSADGARPTRSAAQPGPDAPRSPPPASSSSPALSPKPPGDEASPAATSAPGQAGQGPQDPLTSQGDASANAGPPAPSKGDSPNFRVMDHNPFAMPASPRPSVSGPGPPSPGLAPTAASRWLEPLARTMPVSAGTPAGDDVDFFEGLQDAFGTVAGDQAPGHPHAAPTHASGGAAPLAPTASGGWPAGGGDFSRQAAAWAGGVGASGGQVAQSQPAYGGALPYTHTPGYGLGYAAHSHGPRVVAASRVSAEGPASTSVYGAHGAYGAYGQQAWGTGHESTAVGAGSWQSSAATVGTSGGMPVQGTTGAGSTGAGAWDQGGSGGANGAGGWGGSWATGEASSAAASSASMAAQQTSQGWGASTYAGTATVWATPVPSRAAAGVPWVPGTAAIAGAAPVTSAAPSAAASGGEGGWGGTGQGNTWAPAAAGQSGEVAWGWGSQASTGGGQEQASQVGAGWTQSTDSGGGQPSVTASQGWGAGHASGGQSWGGWNSETSTHPVAAAGQGMASGAAHGSHPDPTQPWSPLGATGTGNAAASTAQLLAVPSNHAAPGPAGHPTFMPSRSARTPEIVDRPPGSSAEARVCNVGRAPGLAACLGFGGRVAVAGATPGAVGEVMVAPWRAWCSGEALGRASAGAGPEKEVPAPDVPQWGGGAGPGLLAAGAGTWSRVLEELEGFPAPVSASTRAALSEYVAKKAASADSEDAATLWGLVRARLLGESGPSLAAVLFPPASGGQAAEAAIAQSLPTAWLGGRGLAGAGEGPSEGATPGGATFEATPAEMAAAQCQACLVRGDMWGALQAAARGRLWGVAVLVASRLGGEALALTAAAMAAADTSPGSPLRSALLTLGGAPQAAFTPQSELIASMGKLLAPRKGDDAGELSKTASSLASMAFSALGLAPRGQRALQRHLSSSSLKSTNEHGVASGDTLDLAPSLAPAMAAPRADPALLAHWRQNAAALVSLPGPSSAEALVALGRALLSGAGQGSVARGHACLVAAGAAPEPHGPNAGVVLLGGDHLLGRGYWTLEALHLTQLHEATLGPSTAPLGLHVQASVLPWRLLHAHLLAEMGVLPKALQCCSAMEASLKAVVSGGGGMPPSLAVFHDYLTQLKDRLTHHMGALGYDVQPQASGILGTFTRWIDMGINKFVTGSSRAPSRPHSRKPSDLPNSFSGGPPVPRHTASQMEASAPASSPSVIAAPSPDSSGAGHAAPAPRSSGPRSAMSLLGLGRDGAQDTSAVAASPKDATQTEALGKPSASSPQLGDVKGDGQDGAGSGGGWSILRGIVKTFSKKKGGKEIKLGDESKFFFDEKLGCWRQEGDESVPDAGPPPPPPTSAPATPTPRADIAGSGGEASARSSATGASASTAAAGRRPRSRFVDVLGEGPRDAAAPSATASVKGPSPLVPGAAAGASGAAPVPFRPFMPVASDSGGGGGASTGAPPKPAVFVPEKSSSTQGVGAGEKSNEPSTVAANGFGSGGNGGAVTGSEVGRSNAQDGSSEVGPGGEAESAPVTRQRSAEPSLGGNEGVGMWGGLGWGGDGAGDGGGAGVGGSGWGATGGTPKVDGASAEAWGSYGYAQGAGDGGDSLGAAYGGVGGDGVEGGVEGAANGSAGWGAVAAGDDGGLA